MGSARRAAWKWSNAFGFLRSISATLVGRLLVLRVAVADPDVERRAPPALARQRPVDVVREEVAEAPVLDVLGQPLHRAVVRDRPVDVRGGADVPGGTRVLDERVGVGAPAEGVVVAVLLGVDEQAALLEIVADLLVAVLDPAAGVALEAIDERAVGLDRAEAAAGRADRAGACGARRGRPRRRRARCGRCPCPCRASRSRRR